MSTTIDQKSYLQKYLGGPSGEKKKKKKKVVKGQGFKIIDDDIDITKLRPLEGDELDFLGQGEDAPQIAGIIDERPEDVQKLEQFKTSSKWRVINQDDGFNSKLQIEEIKRDVKEVEKENEIIFGKMYSDSEDDKKNDSDLSPPRKQDSVSDKNQKSTKKLQNNSDSDFSPPRRNRESPAKKKSERVKKPSRWGDFEQTRNESNEKSPKRRKHSPSPDKRSRRRSVDSDLSPQRKSQKKNYDSDASPPRNFRKDLSKRNRSPDSNSLHKRRSSPNNKYSETDRHSRNNRHVDAKRRKSTDSDMSPPRKSKRQLSQSPPRKSRKHSSERSKNKTRHDSDSNLSPPRKERNRETQKNDRYKRNSDSPPPTNKKMARTLEGKMAGLQDASQLRHENEVFRKKEDEAFNRMADEVSGRNAQVVSRRAKRETSEDRKKQKEKAERQKELDEKYKRWSKGIKQIEAQEARVQEYIHEASKPLARHRDDKDLENQLKDIERDGDPMLGYIKERKREKGQLGPEKPMYKGNFPPNRFNIRPGYRWDGVDRSNGYEKKVFEHQSKRKAQEEEAYKWSTEDL